MAYHIYDQVIKEGYSLIAIRESLTSVSYTHLMLSRLETMVLMGMELPLPAIRSQIASGIDILIHLGRMRDKSRKVLSLSLIHIY